MTTEADDNPGSAPSRITQAAIVFAFRKIVKTQPAPGGGTWGTKRVLEELWELWDERPREPGWREEYLSPNGGRFYQTIDRIKRGVTRSVRDGTLFPLMEKFVHKHGLPGHYVPPAANIRLLRGAADMLLALLLPASKVPPGMACRFRLFLTETPSVANQLKEWDRDIPLLMWNEKGKSTKVLIVRPLRNEESSYWSVVALDQSEAHYEIGLYIRKLSLVLLRSAASSSHSMTGFTPMPPYRTGRLLHILGTENQERLVTQEFNYFTDLTSPLLHAHRCSLTLALDAESLGAASELLNFVDNL